MANITSPKRSVGWRANNSPAVCNGFMKEFFDDFLGIDTPSKPGPDHKTINANRTAEANAQKLAIWGKAGVKRRRKAAQAAKAEAISSAVGGSYAGISPGDSGRHY